MNTLLDGRLVPRLYEDLSAEELRDLGQRLDPRLEKALQAGIRHRTLIAEGINDVLARSAASDSDTEQPSADTTINTANYTSLTGLAFNLVTPAPCRGLVAAELDYTTTTIGELWVQVWIGGAPVRTRVQPSVLGTTFGTAASRGGLTITAPAQDFPADSTRVVDVKCRAAEGGDFKILSSSLVSWLTIPGEGVLEGG